MGNCFQASDVHAIDRERQEDVRVSEDVVVEEIAGFGAKGVEIKIPSSDRNCHTDLGLVIALAMKRKKIECMSVGSSAASSSRRTPDSSSCSSAEMPIWPRWPRERPVRSRSNCARPRF
jgi:hypothetical protein